MPFKTDFGRGTENKQKKSKLGHPTIRIIRVYESVSGVMGIVENEK